MRRAAGGIPPAVANAVEWGSVIRFLVAVGDTMPGFSVACLMALPRAGAGGVGVVLGAQASGLCPSW